MTSRRAHASAYAPYRFFVVEDHILNTTSGLVTRASIDELWDMAVAKIVAVLKTHIGYCTDPTLMLQIKALIMLFCHTLKVFSLFLRYAATL